jgi:uroporphyrinogen-III decarboxylase
MFCQPGPWQDFCELVGTQEAIFWALDEPQFVHWFLKQLTQHRLKYIHEEMPGAKYDLIEHGGGAGSSTVISPAMFDEFCVPYDRQIIAALHEIGLPVVYHTCGGMMANLEHIPANGCDASETLSPPGMGGDIHVKDRMTVKQVLGSKVALIGGVDQGRILTEGTPEQVAAEVKGCFESFGVNGGYICSASDHFFHAPVENLKAMARAANNCRYW